MQLGPFVDAYGFENILPVFFPRLVRHSQAELERIGRFLNHDGPLRWDTAMKPQNRGKERLRPSPIRQALVQAPVLSAFASGSCRATGPSRSKSSGGPRSSRPSLRPDLVARLREVFDADLAELGSWLGISLDCDNFDDATIERSSRLVHPLTSRQNQTDRPR